MDETVIDRSTYKTKLKPETSPSRLSHRLAREVELVDPPINTSRKLSLADPHKIHLAGRAPFRSERIYFTGDSRFS
ncbi:hypothetical protein F2Q70_00039807 [Brassica cretica]|uniref:Uncharacterized protein n=1 Tax=Brassica cretica TaxID=69181 RepID=A0A8S9K2N1_BRACR|nr:hypothetical protein F2Q70_00039807 [Brassica cretica]